MEILLLLAAAAFAVALLLAAGYAFSPSEPRSHLGHTYLLASGVRRVPEKPR
jgi:hypothetical protein